MASIVGTGVAALAAVAVSTLVVYGPGEPDWWHILGAAGWTVMAWTLTAQCVIRHTERQAAQERQRRAEEAEHEARQLARLNTGTWQGDAVGQVLTVRYDPATGRWYVQGWMGDHAVFHPERRWADRAALYAALSELETTGELEPQDDEGTRAVRARLGLPGWDAERHDPEPVATQPMPGEAVTEVLSVPPVVQGHGPSPAALRPIAVPVFRTEAERALWAAEHDIPTEFLPRLPE